MPLVSSLLVKRSVSAIQNDEALQLSRMHVSQDVTQNMEGDGGLVQNICVQHVQVTGCHIEYGG